MMLHKLIRNITLLELTRLNKNDFSFVFFKKRRTLIYAGNCPMGNVSNDIFLIR